PIGAKVNQFLKTPNHAPQKHPHDTPQRRAIHPSEEKALPHHTQRLTPTTQKHPATLKKNFSLRMKNEPVLVDEVTSTGHDAK
ncbi:hypothetical protein, partial [uncultured Porphyromonas sp.]|uniref:hypothetical protein n=1 Tax=uncultured Porphyromonas sp. TaxID=159274 RepID=UPI002594E9C7